MEHQLQVSIKFNKKINELTINLNLGYFCYSVNCLTLTEFKNCLKILRELAFIDVNVSH